MLQSIFMYNCNQNIGRKRMPPFSSCCNFCCQKVSLNHSPRRCHNSFYNSADAIGRIHIILILMAQRELLIAACKGQSGLNRSPTWLIMAPPSRPFLWFDVMSVNLFKQKSVGCPSEKVRGEFPEFIYKWLISKLCFLLPPESEYGFIIELVWR